MHLSNKSTNKKAQKVKNENEAAILAADIIIDRINAHKDSRPFVLGLPTGSTPLLTYKLLIKAYQNKSLDFSNVITFNMDEYCDIPRSHSQSYWTFMHENFFNHINIKKENINMLNGEATDKAAECRRYEDKIRAVGGIDLFLGGVGSDGHIAFNEPCSSLASRTRVKTLTAETIKANARFFNNRIEEVPRTALTIGVGTLMDAKEVLIIATGLSKALAVAAAVEGAITHQWTVSILQTHPKAVIVADTAACQELKVKTLGYFKSIEDAHIADVLNKN